MCLSNNVEVGFLPACSSVLQHFHEQLVHLCQQAYLAVTSCLSPFSVIMAFFHFFGTFSDSVEFLDLLQMIPPPDFTISILI